MAGNHKSKRRAPKRLNARKPRTDVGRSEAQIPPLGAIPGSRNACLDTLRGLAIVLMVMDHVAGILFGIPIDGSVLRHATRLSMPLFCVLMGYFLKPGSRMADRAGRKRFVQLLAAAVLTNLVFWPYYGRIEILGSLILAYGLYAALGRYFPVMVLAIIFYPVDPLIVWLDYPVTITVSFVAQGMILRRIGVAVALVTGALLSSAAIGIHELEPAGVNHLLCLCLLPATLLVYLGESMPLKRIVPLDWIGRHPLAIYVVQYYLLILVSMSLLR